MNNSTTLDSPLSNLLALGLAATKQGVPSAAEYSIDTEFATRHPISKEVVAKVQRSTLNTHYKLLDAYQGSDGYPLNLAIYGRMGAALVINQVVLDALEDSDLSARLTRSYNELGKAYGVSVVYQSYDAYTGLLEAALDVLGLKGTIDLTYAFSLKDVEYAIGADAAYAAYVNPQTSEDRIVRFPRQGLVLGTRRVKFVDLLGRAGSNASVKSYASSVGLSVEGKTIADEFKSFMLHLFISDPQTFFEYAVGDAVLQYTARVQHDVSYRETEAIGATPHYEERPLSEDLANTTGSLVARTLERHLEGLFPDKTLLHLAELKLDLFEDKAGTSYSRVQARRRNELLRNYLSGRVNVEAIPPEDLAELLKVKPQYRAWEHASVPVVASYSSKSSLGFSAIVNGGRARNENPYRNAKTTSSDVDLSGAYPSVMETLPLVLGVPRRYSVTGAEKPLTLAQFEKRIASKSLTWSAVVSSEGLLSHAQALIYSKNTTLAQIRKAVGNDFEEGDFETDVGKIPGDFVILEREIVNGVLTPELLSFLTKALSKPELAKFRQLKVTSAVYHLESDFVNTPEEWVAAVLAAPKSGWVTKNGIEQDRRPHTALAYDLRSFVEPRRLRRAELKGQYKAAKANGDPTAPGLHAQQEQLKLQNNTVYGDLASTALSVSNVVAANRITANVRLMAFILVVTLGLDQVVTDGGHFEPERVPAFNPDASQARRPSFETLSRVHEEWGRGAYAKRFGQEWVVLGGHEAGYWRNRFESVRNLATVEERRAANVTLTKELEVALIEHVRTQAKLMFDYDFTADVEIKGDNNALEAYYTGSTDYLFVSIVDGLEKVACRGYKGHLPGGPAEYMRQLSNPSQPFKTTPQEKVRPVKLRGFRQEEAARSKVAKSEGTAPTRPRRMPGDFKHDTPLVYRPGVRHYKVDSLADREVQLKAHEEVRALDHQGSPVGDVAAKNRRHYLDKLNRSQARRK